MILLSITYPPQKLNSFYNKNTFLNDIRAYTLDYLSAYFHSNRLDHRDLVTRANLVGEALKENLNIDKPIYSILIEIIYTMQLTNDSLHLEIPKNSKVSGVNVELLYKMFRYGTLNTKGVRNTNILDLSLQDAFDHFIRTGYIFKWGWD